MSTPILLLIALLAAVHFEAVEPCPSKLDLALVVDSSSSICRGLEPCLTWDSVLSFIRNLVNGMTVGPENTMISLLTFGSEVKLEWKYNRYATKSSLLEAIDKVTYKGGELVNLRTAGIFFTELFLPLSGDRPFVPNVVMVITNGIRNIDPTLVAALSTKQFQAIGIKVYIVCITPECPEILAKSASSDPKQANVTYFLVDGYDNLKNYDELVLKQICAT